MGGLLSDLKWGKLRTMTFGAIIGAISHLLFVYGEPFTVSSARDEMGTQSSASLPSALHAGTALLPLLVGVVLLSMSSGQCTKLKRCLFLQV